jgi:hypothetical protein
MKGAQPNPFLKTLYYSDIKLGKDLKKKKS